MTLDNEHVRHQEASSLPSTHRDNVKHEKIDRIIVS